MALHAFFLLYGALCFELEHYALVSSHRGEEGGVSSWDVAQRASPVLMGGLLLF